MSNTIDKRNASQNHKEIASHYSYFKTTREWGARRKLLHTVGGKVNEYSLTEKSTAAPQKLKESYSKIQLSHYWVYTQGKCNG